MDKPDRRIETQLLADGKAVAAAASRILAAASEAIDARGSFHLALAGGTTPQAAYRLLAASRADWSCWHIYFGDERCLPPDDCERNSVMAREAWLEQVAIPPQQIHPIPAELGAEEAAAAYAGIIAPVLPFDMVLLGMGEDGHTASLFPDHRHDPQALVVAVHDAPKPPADRVSLTPRALNQCRALLLLITGAGKHEALQRWLRGEALPVGAIRPEGRMELLLDRAAAGE